ncbi:MAG: restriction endonuclease, partial [Patescibacteria group bacterium]
NSPRGIWELSALGKKAVEKIIKNEDISDLLKSPAGENFDEESEKPSLEIEEETNKSQHELEILRSIEWIQFERLCAKLFEISGFENVKKTQNGADGGIDGFGDLVFGLIKFRVAFQAKKYKEGNPIGSAEIQKLAGSKQQFQAEKAVFITTSHFSSSAKKSADKLDVELIDGEKILEILKEKEIGFRKKISFDFSIDESFFKNL